MRPRRTHQFTLSEGLKPGILDGLHHQAGWNFRKGQHDFQGRVMRDPNLNEADMLVSSRRF
jgi:hypothetical protein